ncbi:MAG: ATP-binding protein [Solobacterium sp.]|jgi:predicted AAA+ superfamily ATPase|nr:ATP-binding protein [Solobacterium sp.]MCH4206280.1 ATP-binding protein [Solobacterium sp.]MCH4227746.1 ATP-binding protein [Solobacterium sp.]
MRLIERESYLTTLINVKNTPDIKVITGARGVGKSKLLLSYIHWIKKNEPDSNIIYINLQDQDNEKLLEYHALHEYIIDNHNKKSQNYLMIDEVQLCKGFEKTLNSIHTKELFDVYVTGSNAFLMSSDLATLFTGRTFTIEVYPFSFKEFIQYFNISNIDFGFDDYLKTGGFAGSYAYKQDEQRLNYIEKDVYETIVTRDIIQKYSIRNTQLFRNLSRFLMDNIGNLYSARSITNYLKQNKETGSSTTVAKYIDYLTNAYVFYRADRFDIKGKKYLSSEQKYYLVDPSLRNAVNGNKNQDYGRMLENIVYLELLRRGYEVYVGKLYRKEVDFVAVKRDEQIYIQVSAYLDDPKTLDREMNSLLNIRDAYPKMIIARTHLPQYTMKGILIRDIADWLAND